MNDTTEKSVLAREFPSSEASGIDFKGAYIVLYRALMRVKTKSISEGVELRKENHHAESI